VKIIEPKVEIISATQDALELMLLTKSTRLKGGAGLAEITGWPMEKKLSELAYMKDTIKSSWEFVDYVFLITGVSRVFTHQFVRTRTMAGIDDPAFGAPEGNAAVASFAQEAQRTIDASDNGFSIPNGAKLPAIYENAFYIANEEYKQALASGENYQDARSILPNAITTSIVAKISLRVLSDMANVRLCTRAQGEYQKVFRMMRQAVYDLHPWTEGWIDVYCVNHGSCCFPRYAKCPVQAHTFNPETGIACDGRLSYNRNELRKLWEVTLHEANPVAKDGRTQ
jgi:thymidylate synthase ThyX